jgi:hypothetical protein
MQERISSYDEFYLECLYATVPVPSLFAAMESEAQWNRRKKVMREITRLLR